MSDEAIKLREKYKRFRALVVGRANAGKTTILKTVCNSTENPRIYDSEGNERNPSIISPTSERGEHNIDDELVFSSNTGFVFHDSRGFEAGSIREVETMKKFIEARSNATSLDEQLHAIWYCIPVDNARLLTAAELELFDKCDPKGVPVVAIFTKFDSLDAAAFAQLQSSGLSDEEAESKCQQVAEERFKHDQLPRILDRKFPPARTVFLRDMNIEGANCGDLIEQTIGTLNTDTLKMLLVSVQQTNLRLCVRYALEQLSASYVAFIDSRTISISSRLFSCIEEIARAKSFENETLQRMLFWTLCWFPHTWRGDFEYEDTLNDTFDLNWRNDIARNIFDHNWRNDLRAHTRLYMPFIKLHLAALTQSRESSIKGNIYCHTSSLVQILSVCCAILINLEYSFSTESGRDKPTRKIFGQSLQYYVRSDSLLNVRKALFDIFGNAPGLEICIDISCREHYPPSPPPASPPARDRSRLSELLHKVLRLPDAITPILVELGSAERSPCHCQAGRAFSQDDMMKLYSTVVDNFLPRPADSQLRNRRMPSGFSYFCL